MRRHALAGALALALLGFAGTASATDASLQRNIDGDWRSAENRARDDWRHPAQTLRFFGVRQHHRVIEITPGNGWYSEILAPWLRQDGHYVAAVHDPADGDYFRKSAEGLKAKYTADPECYGKVEWLEFKPATPRFGNPASADVVLTFRNVHNWTQAGNAPAYFNAFFDVLKPGGVLGVVDHRARQGASTEESEKNGYLPTEEVIRLGTDAGFRLDASSEINANPRDTKDHPGGVWSLPPVLRHGDQDRAHYQAIGESDRFTLRFVKP
ncbi:class I SAM-dependent methyltransferase [Stutzerimonas kirkiae]|uniref:class I SAM-dependent methyltransferase n=1 Tax=Stutzerimonas kirkiae TaxID=2211392 RepID=UPI0010384387|nr:class I SAM-dependent methyltransferase [Stutzerimonas kirkiae]TBV07533.1 methyltransferase [Stutzerimonas kirkiae]